MYILGLPDKKAPTSSICLNMKKELTFSPRTIANTFKKHFANLANDLVKKLWNTFIPSALQGN